MSAPSYNLTKYIYQVKRVRGRGKKAKGVVTDIIYDPLKIFTVINSPRLLPRSNKHSKINPFYLFAGQLHAFTITW